MPDLHLVVCIKVVPKPEEIQVDRQTMTLTRDNVRSEINPPDMNALEAALRLKDKYGCRVDIISMGPPLFKQPLQACLAMGADNIYLLSDRAFAGADTLATTYTLSKGIQRIGEVDLVFCGEESSDGATGQVPPGLAEWLGCQQISAANQIELNLEINAVMAQREIKNGYEVLQTPLPAVLSLQTASNEPRFINYQIKDWAFDDQQFTVWDKADLEVDESLIGIPGSPTVVSGLEQADSRERKNIFLEGSTDEITNQLIELIQSFHNRVPF
ncbi:electron transfer flavoprotein subunit beta/FixA family protein [Chloroflexota bacterium]